VFSLLFTPIGRYISYAIIILVVLMGIYEKIRIDAVAEIEAAAMADALRRTQDAIHASDSVDVSPDGLLKSDGYRRE
jgi:hypothetical protein